MLKYKDLYNYIIGVLYDLKKNNKTGFFSLKYILDVLGQAVSTNEIYEIGKYLEAEGYVKADFNIGDVFIEITPSGTVHIENKESAYLDSFEKYINEQKTKTPIQKPEIKLSEETIMESRKPLIHLIDNVIQLLERSKYTQDLYLDAKILKQEVEKTKPDREVIQLKINNLEQLSELQKLVFEIKDFIN